MPVDNKRHNPKVRLQAQFNEPAVLSRVDLEDFPEQFAMFAEDIMNFLDCLNEFPEFIDEAMNSSINSFAHDLKVLWLMSLKTIILTLVFSTGLRVY